VADGTIDVVDQTIDPQECGSETPPLPKQKAVAIGLKPCSAAMPRARSE